MGKLKGFIEYERTDEGLVPVKKRVKNYKEFTLKPSDEKLKEQGGRCMDCGVPFCHSGCPLGNKSVSCFPPLNFPVDKALRKLFTLA